MSKHHHDDFIDADYTVEYESDDTRNEPYWRIWTTMGQQKAHDAWSRLEYLGERDRCYWYRDRRDRAVYSLPTESEYRRWTLERKIAKIKQGPRTTARFFASLFFIVMIFTTLPLLLAVLLVNGNYGEIPAGLWAAGGLALLGFLVSFWRYRGPAAAVDPLPTYRLWLSDLEQQDRHRARANRGMLTAVLLTAWGAHRYHEHERKEFAEDIAEAMRRNGRS